MELTPVAAYLKVLEVGGKFEVANFEIFALVLLWVIVKACECLTSRIKNVFYPTPLLGRWKCFCNPGLESEISLVGYEYLYND